MKKIVACTLVVLAANVALFLTDYAGGRDDTSDAMLSPALAQSTAFHPDAQ